MVCDDTKRIIIIKNIQSNLIEEAIIVLKSKSEGNKKGHKLIFSGDLKKANAHIIKEAEEIINNYIKEKKVENGHGTELNLKPFSLKKKIFSNMVINSILIGSIGLLVFMVAKLF